MTFENCLKQLLLFAEKIHNLSNELSSYGHADDKCVLTNEDYKKLDEIKTRHDELNTSSLLFLTQIKINFSRRWKKYIKSLIKKLELKKLENIEQSNYTNEFMLALIPDLLNRLNEELSFLKIKNFNEYNRLTSSSYSIWWALSVSEKTLKNIKL